MAKLNKKVIAALTQFKDAGEELVDELNYQGNHGIAIVDELARESDDAQKLDHVAETCVGLAMVLEEVVRHFAMETEGHLLEIQELLERLDVDV